MKNFLYIFCLFSSITVWAAHSGTETLPTVQDTVSRLANVSENTLVPATVTISSQITRSTAVTTQKPVVSFSGKKPPLPSCKSNYSYLKNMANTDYGRGIIKQ